jgi:hypothetical protein
VHESVEATFTHLDALGAAYNLLQRTSTRSPCAMQADRNHHQYVALASQQPAN